MWKSRNKTDLIFEVWEKLDCESVGAAEIEAIETVVRDEFGGQAVESPMAVARMLADEGAMLRHSEIMRLYLDGREDVPYEAEFRNLFDITDLPRTLRSIRSAESLRRKFANDGDREGLRQLRELAIETKESAAAYRTAMSIEAAQWITLWLQSPDLFENWIKLRTSSADFKDRFGVIE